jgi:hypothetical protein
MLLWLLNLDFAGGFAPSVDGNILIKLEPIVTVSYEGILPVNQEGDIPINTESTVGV